VRTGDRRTLKFQSVVLMVLAYNIFSENRQCIMSLLIYQFQSRPRNFRQYFSTNDKWDGTKFYSKLTHQSL